MVWMSPRDPQALDRVSAFGRILRRARQCAGLSQQGLADLSGVSQTTISRLERGRAPHIAIDRILALQAVLGGCLPFGLCPHDHNCIWQARTDFERDSLHRPAAVKGLSFQWPHDDVGQWAEDYPELASDDPVPVAPAAPAAHAAQSASPAAQSARETEIAPPTGLAMEVQAAAARTHAADPAEATDVEDQSVMPDWMFDLTRLPP
jgi:plasmid maintenance system antidote protein VapI